mmetsp:Transcript_101398/g.241820  ORF Transcript_101398/g.241820 Transcript_101398/m.241820 type:complete len:258 (+) Transcript_101398:1138-1911(+)
MQASLCSLPTCCCVLPGNEKKRWNGETQPIRRRQVRELSRVHDTGHGVSPASLPLTKQAMVCLSQLVSWLRRLHSHRLCGCYPKPCRCGRTYGGDKESLHSRDRRSVPVPSRRLQKLQDDFAPATAKVFGVHGRHGSGRSRTAPSSRHAVHHGATAREVHGRTAADAAASGWVFEWTYLRGVHGVAAADAAVSARGAWKPGRGHARNDVGWTLPRNYSEHGHRGQFVERISEPACRPGSAELDLVVNGSSCTSLQAC